MSAVTQELEQTLNELDAQSATLLERLVRDALALVRQKHATATSGEVDAIGWPVGYFEKTAGSFADERLDLPQDPPPDPTPKW